MERTGFRMIFFSLPVVYQIGMDTRKAKTIRLDAVNWQAIRAIKTEHGITADSDAIRFALRMALREIEKSRLPHPKQGSATSSPE
jgi:hypothetical protein